MKKSLIEELKWRGLIHDLTPGLEERLDKGMVTGYIGFDPTAPSLTIGNYVQIMLLKFLQLCGHKPIVLMGGATGRIGDPSGKDAERELKSYDELDKNLAHQVEQIKKLLDFNDQPNSAVMLNNLDFYKNMNALEFLRDVGKHITISSMLSKDSVKNRINIGMSFTEFSYQLLQAYDFLHLYRDYNCVLQMGGSDQWGNITTGTEFIRKNEPRSEVFALTTPLLIKADGKKFGKSEEGNVWLDPEMTSPYKFYQFWINVDDRDLPKLFRFFSLKERNEIEHLENQYLNNPNALKHILAKELTIRIHGEEEYRSVNLVSEIIFDSNSNLASFNNLKSTDFELIIEEIPSVCLWKSLFVNTTYTEIISKYTKIFKSVSEARSAIEQNSITINKIKLDDINKIFNNKMLAYNKYLFVEHGKKSKYLILFSSDFQEFKEYIVSYQNINNNDIYNITNSNKDEVYLKLFNYYQENLFRNWQYGISPSYFYISTNTNIGAGAKINSKHQYFISINRGLVDLYFAKFNWGNLLSDFAGRDKFNYLESMLQNPIGELMYQFAIQFAFYHELGHLIQFANYKKEAEISEYLSFKESFSLDSHISEIDSDLFSSLCLSQHLLQFIERHDIKQLTHVGVTLLLSIAASTSFIFFIYLDTDEDQIYLEKKSHPHPLGRILNVVANLTDSLIHFLEKSGIKLEIDKHIVFNETLELSENLIVRFYPNYEMQYLKDRSKGKLPELSKYIQSLVNKVMANKTSATQIRNRIAQINRLKTNFDDFISLEID
jgi:tyrosyl-tRNA synthetase